MRRPPHHEELAPNPLPPWHMWGTSELITAPAVPVGTPNFQSVNNQQMARVNYGRPERWSFFFGGRITENFISVGDDQVVELIFDLNLGVGRSVFQTLQRRPQNPLFSGNHGYCRFRWNLAPGINGTTAVAKYATRVPTPLQDDDLATSQQVSDWFPAQDVNCQCTLIHTKSDPLQTITVEATAYFAPTVHVRPDWFARAGESERFRGAETGGR